MSKTLLIDYGAGNLQSVANALHSIGAAVEIISSGAAFPANPTRIILPGVGSFGDSMNELVARGLDQPVRQAILAGIPFLGICVGYQLLFEESEESPGVRGLSLLQGKVVRFSSGKKIPHLGWNAVRPTDALHPCWQGMPEEAYFYFVHSYFPMPTDSSLIAATTEYQESFAAAVIRDNLWAVQFHPEKSQDCGIQLLKNFLQQERPYGKCSG